MLKVKKLHPDAKLPEVAHPGEDLGYDLFALEGSTLVPFQPTRIRTGIAAQAYSTTQSGAVFPLGLLIRDRSSMASNNFTVSGGVIDAGYTGEITVLLTNGDRYGCNPYIEAGTKVAQMIPITIRTGEVVEVEELRESSRGDAGFGSTGQ